MDRILIIAGAGTGKTTMISGQVKQWIDGGVDPSKILCLTFSNEAAINLKRRITEKTGVEVLADTFHGFCSRVLQEGGRNFKLLTEPLQILRVHRLGADKALAPLYAKTISKCKNSGITLESYGAMLGEIEKKLLEKGFENQEVAYDEYVVKSLTGVDVSSMDFFAEDFKRLESYRKFLDFWRIYESSNREENFLDYEDLQLEGVKFLSGNSVGFTHLAVDEFQDVDSNQLRLIELVGRNASVAVVADPNQSIYGFRGAKNNNIGLFESLFNPERRTLDENHRSTNQILKASFNLIKNNGSGMLLHSSFEGEGVKVVECASFEAEAAYVAGEIAKLKDFHTVGVLYRYRHHSTILKKELEKLSIPFELVGSDMLNAQVVKDCLSYLQVVHFLGGPTPASELSLLKVFELNGVGKDVLKSLSDLKKKKKVSFAKIVEGGFVQSPSVDVLKGVLERLRKIRVEGIGGTLDCLCDEFDLTRVYSSRDDRRALSDFNDFRLFIKNFEEESSDSLGDFLDFVDIAKNGSVEVEGKPSAGENVKLMTIHAAKGLEFDVVFVINATKEGFFPTHRKSDLIPLEFHEQLKSVLSKKYVYKMTRDNDLKYAMKKEREAEERRLFYVAMTRARRKLFITVPLKAARDLEPVKFVGEMGDYELLKPVVSVRKVEREVKEGGLKINSLSFSSIESYLKCPKYFEFKHLLGFETEPSKPLLLGTFVHSLLNTARIFTSFEQLEKQFEAENKNFNFDRREVMRMLKVFWERNKDTLKNIIQTEDFFSIELDGFKFTGRIDRYDRVDGGVEIIDYKTGSPPFIRVQLMQLGLYALALQKRGLEPKILKIESLKDKTVSYRVEGGKIIGKTVEEPLESVRQKLVDVARRINSDYNNSFQCNVGYQCATCEFRQYCNES